MQLFKTNTNVSKKVFSLISVTLLALWSQDLKAFNENELYYLILIYHIDFHISRFKLRPHESWSKHNANALGRH